MYRWTTRNSFNKPVTEYDRKEWTYVNVHFMKSTVIFWAPCSQRRFRLLVRRSGTRCLTNSEIRRVVLTVLISFLRQSCLVFTNVTSALEVFLNVIRYIKARFTYLLKVRNMWPIKTLSVAGNDLLELVKIDRQTQNYEHCN